MGSIVGRPASAADVACRVVRKVGTDAGWVGPWARSWLGRDDKRDAFGDTVIDTIAEYAPNLRNVILHRQVLTPLDIEREFGLTEGNIFQGELTLEQLFFLRPAPGWAQYRTPIKNLYMCGSSTHPGGGIMGAPGRNAARRILKDLGASE